jgi:DNA-binding beta-propeller fold protein YncE
MALPSTIANPNGEIDLIDPHTHAVVKVFAEAGACNANGTALGQNETLFLGCSSTGEILTINAVTGATVNTISGFGGCDEVWYNPTANRFYAACSNNTSGPVLVVADGTGKLITSFPTSTGAHSVAVDPATDHIFVPTQKLGLQVYSH